MSASKILIIEDEKFALDSIAKYLDKEGYSTTKSIDKDGALAEIAGQKFDLIITDIMLPHLGGFDIIEFIRADKSNATTPVLIQSGMDKEIFMSTLTGADDYILKPYDIALLVNKVKDMLGHLPANSNNTNTEAKSPSKN